MKKIFGKIVFAAMVIYLSYLVIYFIVYKPFASPEAKLEQHIDSLKQMSELHQEIATVYWKQSKKYPSPEASKEYTLWFRHSMKVDSLDQVIGNLSLEGNIKKIEEHHFIQR